MEKDFRKYPESLVLNEKVIKADSGHSKVSAGANQTFFLTEDAVFACGDNNKGQLGLARQIHGLAARAPIRLEKLDGKVRWVGEVANRLRFHGAETHLRLVLRF